MYEKYSFDMWNTLIRPNPQYKIERDKFMANYVRELGYGIFPVDSINSTFIEVKKEFDMRSQLFGVAPNPLEMWAMIVFRLTGSVKNISQLTIVALYSKIEAIFLENPPIIYNLETLTTLEELKTRDKSLSILSNTFFIKGSTINKVLKKANIFNLFDHVCYSDEIGHVKPFPKAFGYLHSSYAHQKGEIVHIGDDKIADYHGAKEYGIGAMLINDGTNTIIDVLNL